MAKDSVSGKTSIFTFSDEVISVETSGNISYYSGISYYLYVRAKLITFTKQGVNIYEENFPLILSDFKNNIYTLFA